MADAILKDLYKPRYEKMELVEKLAYHMRVDKWKELGIKYGLEGVPTPTKEEVELARKILCVDEYNRYKNA